MKKRYDFNLASYESMALFEVDLEKFTPEMAQATLDFFMWDYDKEADPVDEVMKKYAIEAMRISTINDCNELGVIDEFENKEGFAKIDGSDGITLISVTGFEFEERLLDVEITDLPDAEA